MEKGSRNLKDIFLKIWYYGKELVMNEFDSMRGVR